MADLTTLQLARRISDAVLNAAFSSAGYMRDKDDTKDMAVQAVLRVLHETGSWFCRLEDTPKGTVETPYERHA